MKVVNELSLTPQLVRRVIPLTEWNRYHVYPNQSGLRHLVFNADKNGFSRVVRRAGRRVLIDEIAFFEWLDVQGGNHAS